MAINQNVYTSFWGVQPFDRNFRVQNLLKKFQNLSWTKYQLLKKKEYGFCFSELIGTTDARVGCFFVFTRPFSH